MQPNTGLLKLCLCGAGPNPNSGQAVCTQGTLISSSVTWSGSQLLLLESFGPFLLLQDWSACRDSFSSFNGNGSVEKAMRCQTEATEGKMTKVM